MVGILTKQGSKVPPTWICAINITCWFDGSSFKGFSIVFPAPWLAKSWIISKVEWNVVFQTFFAPYLFHRSRNNRRDKLRSKFWRENMFRKPHLKLLRWCSVRGINKTTGRVLQCYPIPCTPGLEKLQYKKMMCTFCLICEIGPYPRKFRQNFDPFLYFWALNIEPVGSTSIFMTYDLFFMQYRLTEWNMRDIDFWREKVNKPHTLTFLFPICYLNILNKYNGWADFLHSERESEHKLAFCQKKFKGGERQKTIDHCF